MKQKCFSEYYPLLFFKRENKRIFSHSTNTYCFYYMLAWCWWWDSDWYFHIFYPSKGTCMYLLSLTCWFFDFEINRLTDDCWTEQGDHMQPSPSLSQRYTLLGKKYIKTRKLIMVQSPETIQMAPVLHLLVNLYVCTSMQFYHLCSFM